MEPKDKLIHARPAPLLAWLHFTSIVSGQYLYKWSFSSSLLSAPISRAISLIKKFCRLTKNLDYKPPQKIKNTFKVLTPPIKMAVPGTLSSSLLVLAVRALVETLSEGLHGNTRRISKRENWKDLFVFSIEFSAQESLSRLKRGQALR